MAPEASTAAASSPAQRIDQLLTVEPCPRLTWGLRATDDLLFAARFLARRPGALSGFRRGRVHRWALSQLDGQDAPRFVELPRIRAADCSESDIRTLVRRGRRPVVIEGLWNAEVAQGRWKPDWIVERFGDVLAPMDDALYPMRYVLDEMSHRWGDERMSLGTDFLYENPEILEALNVRRIRSILGGNERFLQMFITRGDRRSGYHAANLCNMFILLHGEKEWFLVHPHHSPLLDAEAHEDLWYVNPTRSYAARTPTRHERPKLEAQAHPPVTVHRALIGPGDVLLNPAWWWHTVDTRSPVSVAIATRCCTRLRERFLSTKPLYSALQLFRLVHLRDIGRLLLDRRTTSELLYVPDEDKRERGAFRSG